jgi:metal-responsive CopG/Arc/MetJ family transcriptional regulator
MEGTKMKKIPKSMIAVTINPEVLIEIDRLSSKYGLNRSQLINNILVMGVGEVKLLDKVGLIDLANMIRNFQTRVSRELRVA